MVVAESATSVKVKVIIQKLKLVKLDSFAPGFLAWVVISFYGKPEVLIIPKGVKVNLQYFIGKVLEPLINYYVNIMYICKNVSK